MPRDGTRLEGKPSGSRAGTVEGTTRADETMTVCDSSHCVVLDRRLVAQSAVFTTLFMFILPIGMVVLWILASSTYTELPRRWYLVLPLLIGGTFLFYSPQQPVSGLLVAPAAVGLTGGTLLIHMALIGLGWSFFECLALAFASSWVIVMLLMCGIQGWLHRKSTAWMSPWVLFRMMLARVVVIAQLPLAMIVGGWFGKYNNTFIRMGLCSVFPLSIAVVKKISFAITAASADDHVGEMSMLNFNSQFFAAFPYRAIFLAFTSFWELAAILLVEVGYKVIRYVFIPLPCTTRFCARVKHRMGTPKNRAAARVEPSRPAAARSNVGALIRQPRLRQTAAAFSMKSMRSLLDEQELQQVFDETSERQRLTVILYVHQAVDTIGLVAAAVLFSLLRGVSKTSFDVPAISKLSHEEWRSLLIFYLIALLVELLLPSLLLTLRWRIFDSRADAKNLLKQGFLWMNFHQIRIGLAVSSTFFSMLIAMIVASEA